MNGEKILRIIKESKLHQLRRELNFFQAFLVGFLTALIISSLAIFKDFINENKVGGDIFLSIILMIFVIFFGFKFANASLLVEFKEKGVYNWKRKKALDYINEEKEAI